MSHTIAADGQATKQTTLTKEDFLAGKPFIIKDGFEKKLQVTKHKDLEPWITDEGLWYASLEKVTDRGFTVTRSFFNKRVGATVLFKECVLVD